MEIACVITEANLNIIDKAPTFIIHQPKEILDKMGPWCQDQHAKVLSTFCNFNIFII